MKKVIIKMTLVGILFIAGLSMINVNEGFSALLMVAAFFIFISTVSISPEQHIRLKIRKLGGNVISIEMNKSFIKDVNKIKNKERYWLHKVYKIVYELDGQENMAYFILYRDFVQKGKGCNEEWVHVQSEVLN